MVGQIPTPVLEPETPGWFKRWLLRAATYFVSAQPTGPQRLYALPTAQLPDPAKFTNCIMIDTTLGTIVHSNGTNWI